MDESGTAARAIVPDTEAPDATVPEATAPVKIPAHKASRTNFFNIILWFRMEKVRREAGFGNFIRFLHITK